MSAGAETTPGERYCPTCERTFFARDRCPDDGTRLVKLTRHDVDLLLGRDLDGRYTIVDKIGKGGMGTVYRATQHGLGREVAIKVVTPSLVQDPVVIKRFLREAKLASRLSHPNAVSVLDFGQTDDGLFYLVMELVKGRTLDTILAEGAITPQRVVRIGSQICDALEGAHALQIIHRDLKPSNVMIMAASRDLVKVLDFGLAKSLHPDATTATMTNAGAMLGTPAFLPPESIGGGAVDGRADLYSLGCILYATTMGRLPFTATAVPELIALHASEPPPPLVGAPVGLARVIEKLLAKDPDDRYATAAIAREALEASLANKEVVKPAEEPVQVAESSTMLGWATPAPGVPIVRRTADSAPIARPRTGENPPIARPRTGESPPLQRPQDSQPMPRASDSQPMRSAEIPMPSPSSVVASSRADTDIDDDLLTSSPTLIAPEGIVPVIPKGMSMVAPTASPTSLHPTHKTERDPRRPPIVMIVLALLLVAGGGLAAFLLLR